ncbi:hypothetical protein J6590_021456 [Homalodisca vitripennis]|nr:hypothetical protein J6590_021456 [Homalodisca vitripennis]
MLHVSKNKTTKFVSIHQTQQYLTLTCVSRTCSDVTFVSIHQTQQSRTLTCVSRTCSDVTVCLNEMHNSKQ